MGWQPQPPNFHIGTPLISQSHVIKVNLKATQGALFGMHQPSYCLFTAVEIYAQNSLYQLPPSIEMTIFNPIRG